MALAITMGTGFVVFAAFPGQNMPLQGSWVAVAAERNGQPADDVKGHLVQFKGDTFAISLKGKLLYRGTFRVDASRSPATIDFEHRLGKLAGKSWQGIFETAQDTLKICDNAPDINKPRPVKLAADKDSGHVLVILKREK